MDCLALDHSDVGYSMTLVTQFLAKLVWFHRQGPVIILQTQLGSIHYMLQIEWRQR